MTGRIASADAVKRAVAAANPSAKALVLDLRDNPGGLLEEAVKVADLFLDTGPIVSTRGRMMAERVYPATPGGYPATLPVVVVVNGQSASASEIVTGALQDTGRAAVVGTPTYGKGSVQTVFGYADGSALKLTIALYFTPSGAPVAPKEGRKPDVVVDLPGRPDPRDALRDRLVSTQLTSAERGELLALIAELPPSPATRRAVPWTLEGAARLQADPPLRAAVDLAASRVK
jgi:carboxyl-terminal processing protease